MHISNFHSIKDSGVAISASDTLYITPVPLVNRVSVQVVPDTVGTCAVYITTVPYAHLMGEIGGGPEEGHWAQWDNGVVNAATLDFLEMTPTAIKIKALTGNWHAYVRSA